MGLLFSVLHFGCSTSVVSDALTESSQDTLLNDDSDGNSTGNNTTGDNPGNNPPDDDVTIDDPVDYPDPYESQGDFTRIWDFASENSAVVFWQLNGIERSAVSYVEYGETASYGSTTPITPEARWAQFHRITGLSPDTTYHYRMVFHEGEDAIASEDRTFQTATLDTAIRIPDEVSGPPYNLSQSGGTYVLTSNITASGTAIDITGSNITLDLNGHTVTFATGSGQFHHGVKLSGAGTHVVRNGHIVQGNGGGTYCIALGHTYRSDPAEVYGISTDVHAESAYPFRFFGAASGLDVHHNLLISDVDMIESRHYPGNDMMRFDLSGANVSVHDNILTNGPHRAMTFFGSATNVDVSFNDVRHHQRFVNGYAFNAAAPGLDIHHNKVTSTGRSVHLTRADILFHDNYLDTQGHMTLDDYPQGSPTWTERRVELHGIKFEGSQVIRTRVFNNFMRITQHLPDAAWDYVPATPLNMSIYTPNAMNEVYNNTIIALTEYANTWHGPYGNSGEWASSIFFAGMTDGPTENPSTEYAVYIHDNEFYSNDLFVSAGGVPNMTIRVENNTFTLATTPSPTNQATPYRALSSGLEAHITNNNIFSGMSP